MKHKRWCLLQVTIHNINDPKFSRKATPVNLRDGVEITRINGPDGFSANPNLAVGSQRSSSVVNDDLNSASSEFGGTYLLSASTQIIY